MKTKQNTTPPSPWAQLITAARRAPDGTARDAAAPLGFATRVVAQSSAAIASGADEGAWARAFERMAARAFGVAGACALVALVWSALPNTLEASATTTDSGETEWTSAAVLDPVGQWLEAVQQ